MTHKVTKYLGNFCKKKCSQDVSKIAQFGHTVVISFSSPTYMDVSISDVPSSTLTLGSSLNASNIKEGDDVYFECSVKANPRPYKITWRHNVNN